MNKILVSLAASLAVLGVVFAQVPGGIQEAPRPGQTPFPLGQGGGMMRMGGGVVSVTCNEKFLFVITNGTILKYDVGTMTKLSETKLPTVSRGEGVGQGAGRGDGGGNRRNNPPK